MNTNTNFTQSVRTFTADWTNVDTIQVLCNTYKVQIYLFIRFIFSNIYDVYNYEDQISTSCMNMNIQEINILILRNWYISLTWLKFLHFLT